MKAIVQRAVLVLAVVCFGGALLSLTQAGAQSVEVAQSGAESGDASQGKDLFRGAERFDNGGPPCMACHSAGGLGTLGGGALGPDLTKAFDKWGGEAGLLGEDGSSGLLSTLPFPTMEPVFGSRPLTPAEQADIAAFLQDSSVAERSSSAVVTLFGIAAGVAIVLFALAGLIWRGRLKGVREPMVAGGRAAP